MANITPKIQQLLDSEHAETINKMLDAGDSPNSVHNYLEACGVHVSTSTVYKYAALRKEQLLTPEEDHAQVLSENDSKARARLLKELDVLDTIIEKGWRALQEIEDAEITPSLVMQAIRLKNDLTGGSHAFLTENGFASLRKLDARKWSLVIQYMMTFIAEDRQAEVQQGVEQIEEGIYEGTPWQEDYLEAKRRQG